MKDRGQVTIFIIIGIILVAGILLFFLFGGGIPGLPGGGQEISPEEFMHVCIEDKVYEVLNLISSQGGFVQPELFRNFQFTGESEAHDIAYLCYNQNYYLSCINQEPMLIQHIKDEIKNYIANDVESCFNELETNLEKKGYVVKSSFNGFDVLFESKKIVVDIDGKLDLSRAGDVIKKNKFEIPVPTRFYELIVVAQEIISQEARFCNFEHLGYMLLYPEFNIDRFRTSDLETIYTIGHEKSEERFRFAVRGCVIPPGF